MLKEITVKNMLSFKNETLFSMEAETERVSEHGGHVVDINGNKLLKVASVYGPNGGGKSNLLAAIKLARTIQSNDGSVFADKMPCVFGEDSVIEETAFFVDEQYEIGYRFSVEPGELITDRDFETKKGEYRKKYNIVSEEVSFRRAGDSKFELLIERDKSGKLHGDSFSGIIGKDVRLAKTKSAVQYIYENFANNDGEMPDYLNVIKHLSEQLKNIRSLDLFASIRPVSLKLDELIVKHEKKLVKLLRESDINIKAIKVVPNDIFRYYFVREAFADGKKKEYIMPLDTESRGTRKIFWLLFLLLDKIDSGATFFCDDMNAYLHPKLFRAVVKLFQENNTKSQLIFNSHDIINMDNELFRRDEIWFAYRDDKYNSKLVPLSNIVNYKGEQVRKDAKYYKQYLEGKYGADPFIKRGLSWNE